MASTPFILRSQHGAVIANPVSEAASDPASPGQYAVLKMPETTLCISASIALVTMTLACLLAILGREDDQVNAAVRQQLHSNPVTLGAALGSASGTDLVILKYHQRQLCYVPTLPRFDPRKGGLASKASSACYSHQQASSDKTQNKTSMVSFISEYRCWFAIVSRCSRSCRPSNNLDRSSSPGAPSQHRSQPDVSVCRTSYSNANFPTDPQGHTYHLGTKVRSTQLPDCYAFAFRLCTWTALSICYSYTCSSLAFRKEKSPIASFQWAPLNARS